MSVRQLIPEGLAEIPPGPDLARVPAGVELPRLSGFECVFLGMTDGTYTGPDDEGPDTGPDDDGPAGGTETTEGWRYPR